MQACLRANDPRRALRHVEALEAEAAEQQSEGEGGAPLSPGIISQLIIALSRSDAECALKARGMHAGLAARGRCPSVGASTALISQVLLIPLLLLPAPLPPTPHPHHNNNILAAHPLQRAVRRGANDGRDGRSERGLGMEPECARGEAPLALRIGARCPCFCASRIPAVFVVEKLRSKLAVTAHSGARDRRRLARCV